VKIVLSHPSCRYPPFRKNFYSEAADITAMTEEETVALRKELEDIKIRVRTHRCSFVCGC
jgi:hypothetical protein